MIAPVRPITVLGAWGEKSEPVFFSFAPSSPLHALICGSTGVSAREREGKEGAGEVLWNGADISQH